MKNFKILIEILLFLKFDSWIKKIKIMRVEKMNEKKRDMIDVLVIRVPQRSHLIDVKTVNFNFSLFRRKLKFQIFNCLKFCFKILKF